MSEFQLEQLSRAIDHAETRIEHGARKIDVFNDIRLDLVNIKENPNTVFYDE